MAGSRLPELTSLFTHLARAAMDGQRAVESVLNGDAATVFTGARYANTTSRVDVAFVLGEEREKGFRIGVWPLNIGAGVLHGWRREHASRLCFDLRQVPMPEPPRAAEPDQPPPP